MEFPEDIYSTKILEVTASMPDAPMLKEPDGVGVSHSKLCGSKMKVSIQVKDGRICDYGQVVEACLLGQAAAAVMARNAVGLSRHDVELVRGQMLAMLKEDGPPPSGIWSDLDVLYPVKDYKPRHTSMMLVFNAVLAAFDDAGISGDVAVDVDDKLAGQA